MSLDRWVMEGLSSQLQTLKYFVSLMLRSMARLRFEVSSKGARIGGNPESRLLWRICLLLHQSLKPRVVGQLRGNPTSFSTNSVTPSRSGTATSNLTITTGTKPASAISQIARGNTSGHPPARYRVVSAVATLVLVLIPLFGARSRKLR